jgi:hypothetical protein
MKRVWGFCGFLIFVSACSSHAPSSERKVVDGGTVSVSSSLASKVDSLAGAAAKALCLEDQKHFDGCQTLGMTKLTEAACNDAVSECRAA